MTTREKLSGIMDKMQQARTAPVLEPKAGIPRRELIQFVGQVRRTTLQILEPVQDWDLSQFRWEHPLMRNQDIYGILELLGSHDQRHAVQIDSVKKTAEFPQT